ncbi:unnamed protein product [Thelazia callipaeda]|uniref:DUF1604 domain-containing protein n=1 Tax=Thelazia callipaeda TaxID=103827 RepID=A0A0N5D3H8_THECL|nr:unnamed protein product [Thelazia callipaeda]
MAELVIYGTELEELDDEKSGVSNKRPLGVEEQVVKDEKGRRRFHGAFTGGFSAGYFNTVGSKEGWTPTYFRSSRDERGEKIDLKPEDFMDEEDLSEFGISARKIKTSANVGESIVKKDLLAWERINEDRSRGKKGFYNEETVKDANEMAPNFMFAPVDFDPSILKSSQGLHGLGYRGLQQTDVLSEKYGILETSLKLNEKRKGISGQAFGVGIFEDDDANIYTNYDLSQYDFAVDGMPSNVSCNDTSFIMASKRQPARQVFEPPRIPSNFRPVHTPAYPNISQMPTVIQKFGERMNHVQRAKFLGEDRKCLDVSKNKDVMKNAFEEEPMKQARFKQYVSYLKRGLNYPQPSDMTRIEWEQELHDFQNVLPPQLRSLIPEVKKRQKPLARTDLAAPIANVGLIYIKFFLNLLIVDERLAAVKMKMFGEKTRSVYEWHPSKQLAKRFNVPDPYPSSTLLGVPLLKVFLHMFYLSFGASVILHALYFMYISLFQKGFIFIVINFFASVLQIKITDVDQNDKSNTEEISAKEKPPEEFLSAIFGNSDESSTDVEDDEEEKKSDLPSTATDQDIENNKKMEKVEKVFTVMDIDFSSAANDDDTEFGPALPPSSLPTMDLTTLYSGSQKSEFF